jgi:hypothetical protein
MTEQHIAAFEDVDGTYALEVLTTSEGDHWYVDIRLKDALEGTVPIPASFTPEDAHLIAGAIGQAADRAIAHRA